VNGVRQTQRYLFFFGLNYTLVIVQNFRDETLWILVPGMEVMSLTKVLVKQKRLSFGTASLNFVSSREHLRLHPKILSIFSVLEVMKVRGNLFCSSMPFPFYF